MLRAPDNAVRELVLERTLKSKTYEAATHGRRIWQGSVGPIHVPNDFLGWRAGGGAFVWENANPRFTLLRGLPVVERAWYQLDIDPANLRFRGDWLDGGMGELKLLGVVPHPAMAVELDRNKCWLRNVRPDFDLELRARPDTFEVFKHLRSPAAPHRLNWLVRSRVKNFNVPPQLGTRGIDRSADRRRAIEIQHTVSPPRLAAGVAETDFQEFITGRAKNKRSDPDWQRAAVYPLVVDVTFGPTDIAANEDDGTAYFVADTWFESGFGSGDNYISFSIASPQYTSDAGTRWTGITVPQGIAITAATIQVNSGASGSSGDIFGDDVDDAPVWSSTSRPEQITRTAASTVIPASAPGSVTLDVRAIVQELVDRPGWSSGNAMRFGWLHNALEDTFRFEDFANVGTDPATLTIEWQVPAPAPHARSDPAHGARTSKHMNAREVFEQSIRPPRNRVPPGSLH